MNDVELTLESANWCRIEANLLLNEYKSCRTENDKSKLIPKLEAFMGKLEFEKRIMESLM